MSRSDFREYDPTLDTWTQVADFRGRPRDAAVAFAIGDQGYLGTGGVVFDRFLEISGNSLPSESSADCRPRAFWPCQLDRVTRPRRNARSEAAISAALLRGQDRNLAFGIDIVIPGHP